MTSITHTRVSLGSQIREALDDMVYSGRIKSWEVIQSATELYPDGRLLYVVKSAVTESLGRTPGEMMDWLNRHGYDIRFGKNPQDASTP